MTAPRAPLELRRFPAPRPAPGGAILEMVASEVCGTDVHLHHGRLAGVPYPIIPGHVSVGRVLETNGPLHGRAGRTRSASGAWSPSTTCSAPAARAGTAWSRRPRPAARSRRVYGITTGVGDGVLGGWAERIELKPGVRVLPLPDGALGRGLHGRRLRPAHRLPRGRAGRHRARRHRGGAGQRAGRPQRARSSRSSPARCACCDRRAGRPPRRGTAARGRGRARRERDRATPRRAPAGCGSAPRGAAPTW